MIHNDSARQSLSDEEKTGLLEDRRLSGSECESGPSDLEPQPTPLRVSRPPIITTPFGYIRNIPWRVSMIRFLVFLVPSFLQGRHAREQIRPAKLHPTAYLDGMRGLAALFVYFCHYFYQTYWIAESWGADDANYNILRLPIIRLFYQGPAAVCVFFVISGYALSYRPLKLARTSSTDFVNTVSSLVFRRGIRLYLPPVISTFMVMCLLRLGVYELTRDFATDRTYMRNVMERHIERLDSNYDQFVHWLRCLFGFARVFSWDVGGSKIKYDVHLWTIPIEFRCSLYLFLVIIGTARLRTRLRLVALGALIAFTYGKSRWDLLLFLSGMVIAETDHIRGAHIAPMQLPTEEKDMRSRSKSHLKTGFWVFLSILSLYLLSQPDARGETTPGWVYLTSLVPDWWSAETFRYWQSIGAILFVLSVGHSTAWRRFFNSAIVQYFGKISYAIYLMHGPVMHFAGYHWEKMAYGITGVEGNWYNAGFVLGACFCVPTVIWWADVFWRAVDIPTVKFAKWFEDKCIDKSWTG